MGTPVNDRTDPLIDLPPLPATAAVQSNARGRANSALPAYNVNNQVRRPSHTRSSDGEGTMVGETDAAHEEKLKENIQPEIHQQRHQRARAASHLTVQDAEYDPGDPLRMLQSAAQSREQANRLHDDLAFLKIERQVSKQQHEAMERSQSRVVGSRSRVRGEHIDEFDEATNPVHEQAAAVYKPLEHPASGFGKFIKRIHSANWLIRYFVYITPVTLILLIPLLLGVFIFQDATVGGVRLMWFMIWLEVVWLTLWLGRIVAKCLPWPIGVASSLFTNNSKKWRDMGKQLELPATLFFWWLAIEISFYPTMRYHQWAPKGVTPPDDIREWMDTTNKVIVSLLVCAVLNFVEKIIIQLIAISFHLRTYADRIEINKFQIGSLTKLYTFSKDNIAMEDYEFEAPSAGAPGSGARTPGQLVNDAAKTTKEAFNRFGDIAGKVAGDFTGKQVKKSTHPHQVILALLHTVNGSQVLARRLYRTFAREETESIFGDDLKAAFDNDEEATAAFTMFDKDLNGDISMEELEAVCVEIGRERKSITASLKDLDSVVAKLDDVFMFVVFIITLLVFLSLISASAAGVLASAGSSVLALSWLFSATAQEFLQSCVFVFVKHPFDVGDRVTIYGNTGAALKGDDYFVKEISLLYTEFKKMEGHVVQAPNSYLNTLFILNQRRSGGLAEALTLTIKFGTTLAQIEGLRNKLLDFVTVEKREYQSNILTELRQIHDVNSLDLNVVFFYKSNWQNEGLRLARRNKFLCALMVAFQELGIEGPQMRMPGQRQSFPVYLQNVPHLGVPGAGHGGEPDHPYGIQEEHQDPPFAGTAEGDDQLTDLPHGHSRNRSGSVFSGGPARQESIAAMNKRVDFSLGMSSLAASDLGGDVYDDRSRDQITAAMAQANQARIRAATSEASTSLARKSADVGRSSSTDLTSSNLLRHSTDRSAFGPRHSLHRNRFLGRRGDQQDTDMEAGMADIPEVPSRASRIDPRSGMISPAAWRTTTNESNLRPGFDTNSDNAASSVGDGEYPPFIKKSATENFEMRRFH